jgi:hypothetical protein
MSKNETDLRGIVAIQCQNGRHFWATFLLPSLGHYLFSLALWHRPWRKYRWNYGFWRFLPFLGRAASPLAKAPIIHRLLLPPTPM